MTAIMDDARSLHKAAYYWTLWTVKAAGYLDSGMTPEQASKIIASAVKRALEENP